MIKNLVILGAGFYFGAEYEKKTSQGMSSNDAVSAIGHDIIKKIKGLIGSKEQVQEAETPQDETQWQ